MHGSRIIRLVIGTFVILAVVAAYRLFWTDQCRLRAFGFSGLRRGCGLGRSFGLGSDPKGCGVAPCPSMRGFPGRSRSHSITPI